MAQKVPSTTSGKVLQILERKKQLLARREPWLSHWQLLGEFINTRKQDFTTEHGQGDFLNQNIFDSTAPKAAKNCASSLIGLLWPATTKRFELTPPDDMPKTPAVKEYYEAITRSVRKALDNPRAGFASANEEYMNDQVVFGTSGIEPAEDDEIDVCFKAWGVKEILISEGKNGKVEAVYLVLSFSVYRMVSEYGYENVSSKTRAAFDKNDYDTKVKLTIAIEPRIDRDSKKSGVKDMPYQSFHIEDDTKHLIRESGFSELPIKVGRFAKLIGEEYGRSPGMDALPDILESNTLWESVTIAVEKSLDPPLGVLDDGRLGGGEINTSAGAINVFNAAGRIGNQQPIFPLYTIGEFKQVSALLEALKESISNHFYIDRLLDFNNETQMTLGEAQLRNRLRFSTLGSLLSRQIEEVYSPVIVRVFNILLKRKKLGVPAESADYYMKLFEGETSPIIIPKEVLDRMVAGREVYDIQYFSPAMRILKAEEVEALLNAWNFTLQIAQADNTVIDNVDIDTLNARVWDANSAPSEVLRSKAAVESIREGRAEAQEEMRQAEMAKAGAEAMRNVGQSGLIPAARNNGKK